MRHDWVPGKVLYSPDECRDAPYSTFQKFLRLPQEEKIRVYTVILEFFVELEGQKIIVEDFYDGCIIYDFADNQVFLCDLDHIHVGSYELKKDRQLGS